MLIWLILIVGALGATLSWILYLHQSKKYSFKKLSPQEVKDNISGENAFIFFHSPTCPICLQAAPLVYQAAGESGAQIFSLNKNRYDVAPWGVSKTPVLAAFREGKEMGRLSGLQTEEKYRHFLEGSNLHGTVH